MSDNVVYTMPAAAPGGALGEFIAISGIVMGWAHVLIDVLPFILTTLTTLLGIGWYSVNLYEYWKTHRRHEPATLKEDPPDGGSDAG